MAHEVFALEVVECLATGAVKVVAPVEVDEFFGHVGGGRWAA
jgi:hypothetical protein